MTEKNFKGEDFAKKIVNLSLPRLRAKARGLKADLSRKIKERTVIHCKVGPNKIANVNLLGFANFGACF